MSRIQSSLHGETVETQFNFLGKILRIQKFIILEWTAIIIQRLKLQQTLMDPVVITEHFGTSLGNSFQPTTYKFESTPLLIDILNCFENILRNNLRCSEDVMCCVGPLMTGIAAVWRLC